MIHSLRWTNSSSVILLPLARRRRFVSSKSIKNLQSKTFISKKNSTTVKNEDSIESEDTGVSSYYSCFKMISNSVAFETKHTDIDALEAPTLDNKVKKGDWIKDKEQKRLDQMKDNLKNKDTFARNIYSAQSIESKSIQGKNTEALKNGYNSPKGKTKSDNRRSSNLYNTYSNDMEDKRDRDWKGFTNQSNNNNRNDHYSSYNRSKHSYEKGYQNRENDSIRCNTRNFEKSKYNNNNTQNRSNSEDSFENRSTNKYIRNNTKRSRH